MLKLGISVEQVAEVTGLPVDRLQALQAEDGSSDDSTNGAVEEVWPDLPLRPIATGAIAFCPSRSRLLRDTSIRI
ncbi:helix-turn-helix domain-containing protein [bacterium]|nr:helix-turn-helix domain-containing protein [bacterium]